MSYYNCNHKCEKPHPKKEHIYKVDFSQTTIFDECDYKMPPYVLFKRLRSLGARVVPELTYRTVYGSKVNTFPEEVFLVSDWARILSSYINEAGGTVEDKHFWTNYAQRKGACLVFRALMNTSF